MKPQENNNLRTSKRRANRYIRYIICVILILIFFINIININPNDSNLKINEVGKKEQLNNIEDDPINIEGTSPKSALGISDFQDPFTKNFSDIQDFFFNSYESNVSTQSSIYYRFGDSSGEVLSNITFSEDNFLLYKSLLKMNLDDSETLQLLMDINSTSFWYDGNRSLFEYGYVRSLNGSNGERIDSNRYLLDNIMPIFVVLETIEDLSINDNAPIEIVENMFNLINSSQFWNPQESLFRLYNSSSDNRTDTNFYAILANLLINDTIEIDPQIRTRAFYLANLTLSNLINERWNNTHYGFDFNSTDHTKKLDVNALGILALLEMWKYNGSIQSPYFINATLLYNKINQSLWNSNIKAYNYSASEDWNVVNNLIDLESNTLMMSACLKFFQLTGNITYYDRAIELYNTFESVFFDNKNKAYNESIGYYSSENKNFKSNLRLCEAYINAFEIYNSSLIFAEYNISGNIPEYIFEQDFLNITTKYTFESFTGTYNITNANITYLFKYPNGTLIDSYMVGLNEGDDYHSILFWINDTFPIGNRYYINVFANTSYFALRSITKYFNITSGIIHTATEELDDLDALYQGQIFDLEFTIDGNRDENITLTAIIDEGVIRNQTKTVFINRTNENLIPFELEINPNAQLDSYTIIIKFMRNNSIYLTIEVEINVILALEYSQLTYSKNSILGGNIQVSVKFLNYLTQNSQEFNVSFSGDGIKDISREETLEPDENAFFNYILTVKEQTNTPTTEIEMSVSKDKNVYYTKKFNVNVIPKLELLSSSFPDQIPQGEEAMLILKVKNNQEGTENYSLYINGLKIENDPITLIPGENRIVQKITPSVNPYDFTTKKYYVELRDSNGNTFAKLYYEVRITLSPLNLLLFYIFPIIIPVGIVLFYKNKDIKTSLLK